VSIERGRDWGQRGRPPATLQVFDDPLDALDVISTARRAGTAPPPIGLTAGDLVATLGGPTTAYDLAGVEEALNVRVDLGAALIDGTLHWFLSHLVARRSWLRGRVLIVANAAFLGPWNIAPRAHPGDGLLDVLDTTALSVSDRWAARRRMGNGTHIPHPAITVRRPTAAQYQFERALPVRLDGRLVGPARSLSVRVEPAAVDLWI